MGRLMSGCLTFLQMFSSRGGPSFRDSKALRVRSSRGNLFTDPELLSLMANITPRQLKISERGGRQRESDVVKAYFRGGSTELYKPLGLSLPSNDDFKSLLVSISTRLTNRYLITTVIQCPPDPRRPGSDTTHWCNIAKPFVWHRNEDAGSGEGAVR